jgi:hypothetical protein
LSKAGLPKPGIGAVWPCGLLDNLFVYRGAHTRLKPVYIFRIPWILFAPERADFSGQRPAGAFDGAHWLT